MRRHHFLAVGAIIILGFLGILCLSLIKTATAQDSNDNLILAPTAPIGITATYIGSGVKLEWQAAQSGTYSIWQYHIWRQDSAGDFNEIAVTDASALTYNDADGVLGDHYKLTAEDNQDPADTSADSEVVAASQPAPTVARSDLPAKELNNPQPIDLPQGVTPQEAMVSSTQALATQLNNVSLNPSNGLNTTEANSLIHASEVHVAQLGSTILVGNKDLVQPILNSYAYEKQILYQHYNKLAPDQKAAAKTGCQQEIPLLETNILNLSEAFQMNAIIAMASCHLVIGQP